MSEPKPQFLFATGQVGSEKAIKTEITKANPALHFAFSKPGFITFKNSGKLLSLQEISKLSENLIFTRLLGEVVHYVKPPESPLALIKLIPEQAILHAFDRDTFVPGDEHPDFKPHSLSLAAIQDLGREPINQTPKLGEPVYDFIGVDAGHYFLGRHLHDSDPKKNSMSEAPGNLCPAHLPENSPSRAYLKLEEASARFLDPNEMDRFKKIKTQALEVGCSPGGATLCMLNKGLFVVGVDPKRMDPSIHAHSRYSHIQKTGNEVTTADLNLKSVNPTWLVVDMSIAPLEALDEIKHILTLLGTIHRDRLRLTHAFITLKLNDWKFYENIPLYLKRVRELGFKTVKAKQLASNRQEIMVFAQR